jgi:hypothetical protein
LKERRDRERYEYGRQETVKERDDGEGVVRESVSYGDGVVVDVVGSPDAGRLVETAAELRAGRSTARCGVGPDKAENTISDTIVC